MEQWEGSGNPLVNVNFDVAAPMHRVFSPMLLVPVPVPMPVVPVPSWIPYVPAPLVLPPPQYTNRLATQGSSGGLRVVEGVTGRMCRFPGQE